MSRTDRRVSARPHRSASARFRRALAAAAIVAISLLPLLAGCAFQLAPNGGPEEKEPPRILESDPAGGATNWHERTIRLTFDRYVEHRIQEALFLSPAMRGEMEISWSGTEAEIALPETLRANTTYALTLGTDVQSQRGHVHIATPYTLAFSTGSRLDSGRAEGRLYAENAGGVFLFAYAVGGGRGDTLDPSHTPPDNVTQVGKDSTFRFGTLPAGRFRLIAVRDEQRNLLYDAGLDAYGLPPGEIVIDSSAKTPARLALRLSSPESVDPPIVYDASAKSLAHVRVRLSKPISASSVPGAQAIIIDTSTHAAAHVRAMVLDPSSATGVELFTDPLTAKSVYRVTLRGLKETGGRALGDSANSALFHTNVAPDTLPPGCSVSISDSAAGVHLGDSISYLFDEPVDSASFERAFTLADSTRHSVAHRIIWTTPTRAAIAAAWQPNSPYVARLELDSVRDAFGNHRRDTVLLRRFRTIDLRSCGTISGTVADSMPQNAPGAKYILDLLTESGTLARRVVVPAPGPFTIDSVDAGVYRLEAFRDDDRNGAYSFGSVHPYHPAEPFASVPDHLKVRARWTVDGVRVRF